MNEILVNINCITYNHEKYIAEAIDSFLMQKTNFKFEILIHDDASTDRTADIIREYQKKYPDIIKPILQKENQYSKGVRSINYKFNFSRSKGKYIALCEGDDYWTDPYKLQKQVEYMENNCNCSMCFHAADIIKVGKGKIDVVKPYNINCISPTEDIILGDGGFIATNSILYRKNIMDNAPDFYKNACIGDYPLQIFTSTKNYAYYINEFMSAYRVGVKGSWSSRMASKENKIEKFITLRKEVANMLNEFDKYSNGRYSNAIQKKIIEDEIQILIIDKKTKDFKNSRYKVIYDSLTIKEKIKIYARCYIPNTYIKLANIKRVMKVKLLYNQK
ncbi:glycosyltransferase [Clostridium tagluense]|uniref:glycosyltransferase n=1 Tax=Clostridium tagluense TaxID=360422 RepID=UPI001C0E5F68|nr:glycosyltransferase [Clostridium tagluense]MBU3127161.1 glycosyltransferase [Clostridium tagluense]